MVPDRPLGPHSTPDVHARAGQRARIRFINVAADTSFRVALGGYQMTVTHTDGYQVSPAGADTLLIGMEERYDVQVTLGDGVCPLTVLAEGKNATALALGRTGSGKAPPPAVRPTELNGVLASYDALHATPSARLSARKPDVTYRLRLTGGMAATTGASTASPSTSPAPARCGSSWPRASGSG